MSLLALENMVAKHDNHQKYLRRRSKRESRTFADLHSYEAECVNDTEDDEDESYTEGDNDINGNASCSEDENDDYEYINGNDVRSYGPLLPELYVVVYLA